MLKAKRIREDTSINLFSWLDLDYLLFSTNTWVFYTRCRTHICKMFHGFRKSKELEVDEMVLHVGNGAWVAVKTIGHFELYLPSSMCFC